MCACGGRKSLSVISLSILFFETGSLADSGAHLLGSLSPSAGATDVSYSALLFTWRPEIRTQVLMLCTKCFPDRAPSPDLKDRIFKHQKQHVTKWQHWRVTANKHQPRQGLQSEFCQTALKLGIKVFLPSGTWRLQKQ